MRILAKELGIPTVPGSEGAVTVAEAKEIAGEMGEADQTATAPAYHVLFALAFFLLIFSLIMNVLSEWIVVRSRKKLRS